MKDLLSSCVVLLHMLWRKAPFTLENWCEKVRQIKQLRPFSPQGHLEYIKSQKLLAIQLLPLGICTTDLPSHDHFTLL